MKNFLARRLAISRRQSEWYQMINRKWYVYIVECSDGTLYTGVTTDLKRRVHEHNTSKKGAKYTASRRPIKLVAHRPVTSQSEALKLEASVKKQRKHKKIEFLMEEK